MAAAATPPSGLGVDSSGGPVIDPTENVKEGLAAAVRRLDDLAERDREHNKQIRELERAHSKEILTLQMDRIQAVRQIDVGAVQTASTAAEGRAAALATQVAAAAEAMRATAEATRLTFTETLTSTVKPLADAISVIQQWMNQQTGKGAQVVEARSGTQGNMTMVLMGAGLFVAIVLGVVGLFVK